MPGAIELRSDLSMAHYGSMSRLEVAASPAAKDESGLKKRVANGGDLVGLSLFR